MSVTYGSCPNGSTWHACTDESPFFFGCCIIDPCNGVGCSGSNLKAAGMGAGPGPDGSQYANDSSYWPNVNCQSGSWYTCAASTPSFQGCCNDNGGNVCATGTCENLFPASFGTVSSSYDPGPDVIECATGQWHSCVAQNPPFQGCCVTNPCTGNGGTCPIGNLFPISHVVPGVTSSAVASTSVSSESAITSGTLTTSTASVITTTSSTQLPPVSSASGPNVALIAGGAAGGSFAGVLLLIVIVFFVRKYSKKRAAAAAAATAASETSPGPADKYLSEAPDTPGTPFNNGKDSSARLSPNLNRSPAPPAYQPPQRSPNRNTQISEIDSAVVYEVGEGQTPPSAQGHFQGMSDGGVGHGLGLDMDHVVELPHTRY